MSNCELQLMKRREIFPSAGSAAEGGKFLPLLLSHLLTSVYIRALVLPVMLNTLH